MIKYITLIILLCLFTTISSAYRFTVSVDKSSDNYNTNSITSGGSGGKVESNIINPVLINKSILSTKSEAFISGDRARIFVEIRNNKRNPTFRNISAIGIRELVDDDLGVISQTAKWKKTDSLEEICDMKLELFRDKVDPSELPRDYHNCSPKIKYYKLFEISALTNIRVVIQK